MKLSIISEELKKDLLKYSISHGWINNETDICHYFLINPSYFYDSQKGKERYNTILSKWDTQDGIMDRYLLEFLGPILRKHKITEISVHVDFQSKTWKFNSIKLVK